MPVAPLPITAITLLVGSKSFGQRAVWIRVPSKRPMPSTSGHFQLLICPTG